jgi:SAM-dependent methyltransferase
VQPQPTTTERVRDHFEEQAGAFDALYNEDRFFQRAVRPGLSRRRELAVEVVREHGRPSVLDIGCGSGRVAEEVLAAGAASYVGVDFSGPMLELARQRLSRFEDKVQLVEGDYLTAPLEGSFDVVLALGFFDYIPNADEFTRRMSEHCSGEVVASFPRWSWLKGPIRKLRYEVINDCPIFNYTESGLRTMFTQAGFARVDVIAATRSGYLVRAKK